MEKPNEIEQSGGSIVRLSGKRTSFGSSSASGSDCRPNKKTKAHCDLLKQVKFSISFTYVIIVSGVLSQESTGIK